jgi:APA family basic amino acid/polyamine antiporter
MTDATLLSGRPFGFWTATAMVVGGMIGAGIFMLPALIAPYGWIGVIGWIIAISGALPIGYALAALTRSMPEQSGGVAVTGAVLGQVVGVLVGWSYWISVWTAIAAIAGTAVAYLGVFLPWLGATPLNGALATIGLIWLLTLTNLAGAKLAGRIQVVTTVLKLLPLLAVIAILSGLWVRGTATAPLWPGTGPGYGGLTAAVTLALFPLVGFEAAGLVAARVSDPARNVMRATMLGIVLTGMLYILISSGIAFALPAQKVMASTAPFALFVETFWGRGAGLVVAAFAAISAIGALNCWVLVQGEVPLASLLVLSTASRSLGKAFEFAALLTTSSALWLYLAICVAALVRRVAVPAAALGAPFTLWALWGAGVEASGWSLALMLTALPIYWWDRRAGDLGAVTS